MTSPLFTGVYPPSPPSSPGNIANDSPPSTPLSLDSSTSTIQPKSPRRPFSLRLKKAHLALSLLPDEIVPPSREPSPKSWRKIEQQRREIQDALQKGLYLGDFANSLYARFMGSSWRPQSVDRKGKRRMVDGADSPPLVDTEEEWQAWEEAYNRRAEERKRKAKKRNVDDLEGKIESWRTGIIPSSQVNDIDNVPKPHKDPSLLGFKVVKHGLSTSSKPAAKSKKSPIPHIVTDTPLDDIHIPASQPTSESRLPPNLAYLETSLRLSSGNLASIINSTSRPKKKSPTPAPVKQTRLREPAQKGRDDTEAIPEAQIEGSLQITADNTISKPISRPNKRSPSPLLPDETPDDPSPEQVLSSMDDSVPLNGTVSDAPARIHPESEIPQVTWDDAAISFSGVITSTQQAPQTALARPLSPPAEGFLSLEESPTFADVITSTQHPPVQRPAQIIEVTETDRGSPASGGTSVQSPRFSSVLVPQEVASFQVDTEQGGKSLSFFGVISSTQKEVQTASSDHPPLVYRESESQNSKPVSTNETPATASDPEPSFATPSFNDVVQSTQHKVPEEADIPFVVGAHSPPNAGLEVEFEPPSFAGLPTSTQRDDPIRSSPHPVLHKQDVSTSTIQPPRTPTAGIFPRLLARNDQQSSPLSPTTITGFATPSRKKRQRPEASSSPTSEHNRKRFRSIDEVTSSASPTRFSHSPKGDIPNGKEQEPRTPPAHNGHPNFTNVYKSYRTKPVSATTFHLTPVSRQSPHPSPHTPTKIPPSSIQRVQELITPVMPDSPFSSPPSSLPRPGTMEDSPPSMRKPRIKRIYPNPLQPQSSGLFGMEYNSQFQIENNVEAVTNFLRDDVWDI